MARFRLPRLRARRGASAEPPPAPQPQPPPPSTELPAPPAAPAASEEKPKRPPPILRWFLREREEAPKSTTATPTLPPPPPPKPSPPSQPTPPPQATRPPEEETKPAGDRLRAARSSVAGAFAAVGRVPAAAGRGLRRFWFSLSVQTRQRLAVAVAVLAVLLVIAFVAVPALPCGAPGGDVCPPSDDAIALVPDDSLAYLHVNMDPDTEQYDKASEVAARVPTLADQVTSRLLGRLPGPRGRPVDFARDVQPWFGGQAALAVIPAGERAAEEVQLLQISDTDGAKKFADDIATGTPKSTDFRDVPVNVDRRGLATAEVGGFLAIGRGSGVRRIIDAQSDAAGTGSLDGESAADAALAALPDERLADAYLSPDGIDRLVGNPRGPLATLDAAVDPAASEGAAVALVANDNGIEIDIRSELDDARARAQPGFFAAFRAFDPSLIASLPPDSLAYIGMADPGKALVSLIEQASADQPGLAAGVASLVKRVKQLGKVDLETELLPSLGSEAAFALQSGSGQKGVPYLEFLSSGVDAERAGDALAGLQGPIVAALNPTTGQTPTFDERKVGDVTAHSVKLSPTVDLTYAIAGSILLVATDPAAVQQLTGDSGGLDEDEAFKEATDGLSAPFSVLAYLNLSGLLTLGEQAGLAEDPAYGTFAPELHKLSALAVAVRQSSTEIATDLRLIVSPHAPPAPAAPSPPKGGED